MNKTTQRKVLSGRDFNQLVFVAVPAFGYELRSFIEGRIWIGPQDGQFFCRAQWQCIAPLLSGLALQTMEQFMTGM